VGRESERQGQGQEQEEEDAEQIKLLSFSINPLNVPFTLWAKDKRSLAEVFRSDPIPSTLGCLEYQSIKRMLGRCSVIPIAQIVSQLGASKQ
jgi:hypothetical protein